MSITTKELIHGAVLAQIVRGGQRPALRMIETDLDKNASTYRIDDKETIHVVYRTPRNKRTSNNRQSWTFQFNREALSYLQTERCHVALVCSSGNMSTAHSTEVCLLTPDQLREVYGLDDIGSDKSRAVTITRERGKQLLVTSRPRGVSKSIPGSALKNWRVPNS